MRRKLQVFISSTFNDLIEERQAAVQAVLQAGHIPAGMELFRAGSESQLNTIKRWIDESDVYMLILGGRYGTLEPISNKSYTQIEYEYALQSDMPVFAVVIEENALESKVRLHGSRMIEKDNYVAYKTFRENVLSKICKFYSDLKDIENVVLLQMNEYQSRDDLKGWVSSGEKSDHDVIKENNQTNLPSVTTEEDHHVYNGFSYGELKSILSDYYVKSIFQIEGASWKHLSS